MLLQSAKESYYSSMIAEAPDQKALFRFVHKISNKKIHFFLNSPHLKEMANHYAEKIVKIPNHLTLIQDAVNWANVVIEAPVPGPTTCPT